MPWNPPFVESLAHSGIERVPGTVFMTSNPVGGVPHAMLHSMKHYKVMHEQVLILSVTVQDVPFVPIAERIQFTVKLADTFYQVTVHYGFKDDPDIPVALTVCAGLPHAPAIDMIDTSFFLGRETLIPKLGSEMAYWRELIFVALFRNAGSATYSSRFRPTASSSSAPR